VFIGHDNIVFDIRTVKSLYFFLGGYIDGTSITLNIYGFGGNGGGMD
jgi:hypothetical protein